jgi:hypothetical protein
VLYSSDNRAQVKTSDPQTKGTKMLMIDEPLDEHRGKTQARKPRQIPQASDATETFDTITHEGKKYRHGREVGQTATWAKEAK